MTERFRKSYPNDTPTDVLKRMCGEKHTKEDIVFTIVEERKRAASALHVATHMVTETFERVFMGDVSFNDRGKKAMLIGLREYDKIKIQEFICIHWMLIYTRANYVYVLHQTTTGLSPDTLDWDKWLLVGYHDSCWINSVEEWMRYYIGEKQCFLAFFGHMWSEHYMTDEKAKKIRIIQQQAYGESGHTRDEAKMWRWPK